MVGRSKIVENRRTSLITFPFGSEGFLQRLRSWILEASQVFFRIFSLCDFPYYFLCFFKSRFGGKKNCTRGPWVLGKRLLKSHVSGIHLMQGLGLFLNLFFLELTILKGL